MATATAMALALGPRILNPLRNLPEPETAKTENGDAVEQSRAVSEMRVQIGRELGFAVGS